MSIIEDIESVNIDYKSEGTGSHKEENDFHYINFPFDRYDVKVKLDKDNRFLEISEIKINKKFVKYNQLKPSEYHDVEEFYKD